MCKFCQQEIRYMKLISQSSVMALSWQLPGFDWWPIDLCISKVWWKMDGLKMRENLGSDVTAVDRWTSVKPLGIGFPWRDDESILKYWFVATRSSWAVRLNSECLTDGPSFTGSYIWLKGNQEVTLGNSSPSSYQKSLGAGTLCSSFNSLAWG